MCHVPRCRHLTRFAVARRLARLARLAQRVQCYRNAQGCPVELTDSDSLSVQQSKLQPDLCQTCDACGSNAPDNMPDWGRGCARECSQLLCLAGEIWDWTEAFSTDKCKTCAQLRSASLCTTANYDALNLQFSDISGNRAKILFEGCLGARQSVVGVPSPATYGECKACEETTPLCEDGHYHAQCGADCDLCLPHVS